MILFVVALPQELKIIKSEIKSLNFKKIKVDFLLTGVGNLNAIYSIKDYISRNSKPDFIINIGVCGKINDDFNDFFQVSRIKYLSNDKENIAPIYIKTNILKSILCSDKIITQKQQMLDENFVDMESYGVSYVCEKEAIPYLILKKPFDIVSNDSKKVSLNDLENCLKGYNYDDLFNQLYKYLESNYIINNISLITEKLKEKHRFTFSETELLKKYINKQIAFGNEEKSIIDELNNLDKESILIKI